jgi:hypothetical protein
MTTKLPQEITMTPQQYERCAVLLPSYFDKLFLAFYIYPGFVMPQDRTAKITYGRSIKVPPAITLPVIEACERLIYLIARD